MSNIIGPRLSDTEFFTNLLDTTRPGLVEIPDLVAKNDYAAARQVFAADVRNTLQPDRFPYVEGKRGNTYMYPDETFEDAAERILNLELISCGTPHQFEGTVDWFINPTFNQYKEWTWQLSRHWEWDLLAEQYRKTGDERFAKGIVAFFQSWVQQAVVPEPTPGNDTLCWRTIEAGIRMGQTWPRVLHSLIKSPHFTDDVIVDWYKSLWEHGWRLRNFFWRFNWRIMEMNGLAQIGILYPQFKDAAAWKAFAIQRMVRELDLQTFADGFQYELSTGYHQVNVRNYELLWDVMAVYDEPIPQAFYTVLEKMHATNVRLMMPDHRLPDLNDGHWHNVAPLMQKAVKYFPQRDDFRWAYSEGKEGHPPKETSLAFENCGYYVMRTGWERDALWLFFDGGHLGTNHQHEDKLNVLLHAYGRLLLTEGGNYAYDASEMRQYVLSTRSHNTIRVDGMDQNRKMPFWAYFRDNEPTEDEIIALLNVKNAANWKTTPAYDVAESHYDEGYGPEAVKFVDHARKIIFLKDAPGNLTPFAIIVDRVKSLDGASHDYQSLWHFNTETANVAMENPLAVTSDDPDAANLGLIVADNPAVTLEIIKGQEAPEWQGWKSLGSGRQGDYVPVPTVSCTWSSGTSMRVVTVLYPTPANGQCPVVRVEASDKTDANAIRLHLSDGTTFDVDENAYA